VSSVYTQRLFAVQGLSGRQTIFAPAGFAMVLVDCSVYNQTISTAEFRLEDVFTGGTFWVVSNTLSDPARSFQWSGRQAFDSGHGLTFNAAADLWDVRATGYILSLP
jgi:hypothetical protein